MAKPPEKKPDPMKPPTVQVLPMNLRPGDVLVDEVAEWRVIGRPYSSSGGKVLNIRVESVKQPGVFRCARSTHTSESQ